MLQPEPEWAGLLDRLDLMHCMLGHPELPLHVQVNGHLHEVTDFEYSETRDAVILLVQNDQGDHNGLRGRGSPHAGIKPDRPE